MTFAETFETGKRSGKDLLNQAVDAYTDSIYRHAYFYLRSRQDAEDVCQEVFLKLYTESKGFTDDNHLKAWLLRVCSNVCKNVLRRKKHTDSLPLDEAMTVAHDPQRDDTMEMVFSLPPMYAAVIYLYYYEGYQTAEIASILGKKDATVRSQLKRGRELLRETLGGSYEK
ncbi:MAG TPA: RNA polymerase subunit sigma-24 [Clostridiales bacterium]|jgi:RNA polymerase sigma-70 factor (ECF subfamily)|nr:RNA polymerase subunit sigma-24 [Clostridiales bacterium]HCG36643.1 RNA polymerase subunit sigma-24 [Clostridiales bacterium]